MSLLNQPILQWLTSNLSTLHNLEIEARFGTFQNYNGRSKFTPGVDLNTFNRLLSYFNDSKIKSIKTNSIDYIYKDIRKSTSDDKTTWIKKKKIGNYNLENYGIRLSKSTETSIAPIPNFEYYYKPDIREKNRTSFLLYQDSISVDMTIVHNKIVYNNRTNGYVMADEEPSFEIEVEIVKGNNFSIFDKVLLLMLTKVQDSYHVYTRSEYDMIVNYYNNMLSKSATRYDKLARPILDHRPLVTARNIKHRDLVDSGILGNPDTSYAVTHKADGLRKILIVHKTGIWLVSPPYDVNCVYRTNDLKDLEGTILDGEIIPKNKQKEGAPATKYWFLTFDCLSTSIDGPSVQNEPLRIRMTRAQVLVEKFKDNERLTINSKNYREIVSATDFFGIMNEMFREQTLLAYAQDGFMFIPTKTEYNPHSEKYDLLTQRVCTKHPDQMKWKPFHELTIDFSIGYDQNKLIAYSNNRGQLVPFTGSLYNPWNQYENTLIKIDEKNVASGSIVEFGWDENEKMLKMKRIRVDKTKPNTREIAISVWEDIHRPVSEQLLKGKTLELMRRYHNRIKSFLYNNTKGTTLLDIGSGRGGDVSKWKKYERIIAVEPNKEHVKTLLKRIESNGMSDKVRIVETEGQDTDTIVRVVREEFGEKGVDVISFMLSLTFFWKSLESLDKMFKTIDETLSDSGSIIFLTMNGDFVKQCFKPAFDTGPVLDSITLDDGSTLSYKPPELHINLPGTIVENQVEWLVQMNDLLTRYHVDFMEQADKCLFLSDSEKLLSSMYTFGRLARKESQKKNTKIIVDNYVLNAVGSPIPVVKAFLPKTVATKETRIEKIKIYSPKRENPKISIEPEEIKEISFVPIIDVRENLAPNEVELFNLNGHEIVRIGAIGDGSCFFHAVLNAGYKVYQEEKSVVMKKKMVKSLRRDLAQSLGEMAENGKTNYQNTSFPDFYRATLGKNIADNAGNSINFGLDGIYDLLDSDKYVGNEVYKYVATMIGIDIIVVQLTSDGFRYIDDTYVDDKEGWVVVINGTTNHYETVGKKNGKYYQTMFEKTDKFITELKK